MKLSINQSINPLCCVTAQDTPFVAPQSLCPGVPAGSLTGKGSRVAMVQVAVDKFSQCFLGSIFTAQSKVPPLVV